MTHLQDLPINAPTELVEIDLHVHDLMQTLDLNLDWVTHAYGRAYRNVKLKDNKVVYMPEVYRGKYNNQPSYASVNPDNDKSAMFFIVVGPEILPEFERGEKTHLARHDVGIVFWCNLEKINTNLLNTEIFTQQLIKDVRTVFDKKMFKKGYQIKPSRVTREFSQVYREFSLKEIENYNMVPYQCFRFDCVLEYYTDCNDLPERTCDVLLSKLSDEELLRCILPNYDFSKSLTFNSLTAKQKDDLSEKLNAGPLLPTGTRIPNKLPINSPNQTAWLGFNNLNIQEGLGFVRKIDSFGNWDATDYFFATSYKGLNFEFMIESISGHECCVGIGSYFLHESFEQISYGFMKLDATTVEIYTGGKGTGLTFAVDNNTVYSVERSAGNIRLFIDGDEVKTYGLITVLDYLHGASFFIASLKDEVIVKNCKLTYL